MLYHTRTPASRDNTTVAAKLLWRSRHRIPALQSDQDPSINDESHQQCGRPEQLEFPQHEFHEKAVNNVARFHKSDR